MNEFNFWMHSVVAVAFVFFDGPLDDAVVLDIDNTHRHLIAAAVASYHSFDFGKLNVGNASSHN